MSENTKVISLRENTLTIFTFDRSLKSIIIILFLIYIFVCVSR